MQLNSQLVLSIPLVHLAMARRSQSLSADAQYQCNASDSQRFAEQKPLTTVVFTVRWPCHVT